MELVNVRSDNKLSANNLLLFQPVTNLMMVTAWNSLRERVKQTAQEFAMGVSGFKI